MTDNTPKRRLSDNCHGCDNGWHNSPCEELKSHKDDLIERLDKMQTTLNSVAEIVVAWNNAKGFVRTLQTIGTVAKWLTGTGAAVALIWYWIKK